MFYGVIVNYGDVYNLNTNLNSLITLPLYDDNLLFNVQLTYEQITTVRMITMDTGSNRANLSLTGSSLMLKK